MGTVQKIWVIFNTPKRQAVLQQKVLEKLPDSKKNKLKQMCPTRWVQRYDAVMVIVELMPAVCATRRNSTMGRQEFVFWSLCLVTCHPTIGVHH